MITDEIIAIVCHEANRAFCEATGDPSQKPWKEAEQWQRDAAINGVRDHQQALSRGETIPPNRSHDIWLMDKISQGWTWGPVKDPVKKEHPDLVTYQHLSVEARFKDALFGAINEAYFKFRQENK